MTSAELLAARAEGHQRADVAFRMFSYRIKKYIAAYAAAMGGVDAVIFTGGIGENSPEVRLEALTGLGFMGLEIDSERNAEVLGREGEITTEGSRVKALVVPVKVPVLVARALAKALVVRIRR